MSRSVAGQEFWWQIEGARVFSLLLALTTSGVSLPISLNAQPGPIPLQLEVLLNGNPTGLIAGFELLPDQRMATTVSELRELRIVMPGPSDLDKNVVLDEIAGLSYRYDPTRQLIDVTVPPDGLRPQMYDAARGEEDVPPVQSSIGAILNYGLTGALHEGRQLSRPKFGGITAYLDGHSFSSMGTLDASGIVKITGQSDVRTVRLATTWTTSAREHMITARVGDFVTGGLPWTRPVRLGGVQAQRNFSLRPDLITMPLLDHSGSAAVPSTVDVFVNSARTYSIDVPAGPFTIHNIPAISGAGTAKVVVRDSAGRSVETEVPFYASPMLLRRGLYDFSVEMGLARRNFGSRSSDYDNSVVGSASTRIGLRDSTTMEGHVEAGAGLVNAGAGFVQRIGSHGVLSLAGSISDAGGGSGGQVFGAFEGEVFGVKLRARSQRSIGDYSDLASVTARRAAFADGRPFPTNGKPARAIDTISAGIPLPWRDASVNLGLIRHVSGKGDETSLVHATYSTRLGRFVSAYINGFHDLSGDRTYGGYAGLSVALGEWGHGSAGVSHDDAGMRYTADLIRPAKHEPGSFGWRLRDSEGSDSHRSASLAYQGSVARAEGAIAHHRHGAYATANLDGAIAATTKGVFLTNRINDAFAVVDAGAPDIDILYENRPAGRTGADGTLLVPNLRSYQRNRISMDPRNLPPTSIVSKTELEVVPGLRSGVNVDFEIESADDSAVVVFRSDDGRVLPVGSQGLLADSRQSFVVGYDGRAYLRQLSRRNTATIRLPEGVCRASFIYPEARTAQVVIEDVICR